ncbi:MAG: phosphatidylglycerophosphatase A [Deltaproteobacteria bacterium]|nr:phosphatidylglycerophosphatase A [Deltaproteobacteria bacterium]
MSPGAVRRLASGLGAGFSPVAPGTTGTLVAIPLAWALSAAPVWVRLGLLLAALPFGAWVCGAAALQDRDKDPGWVVLDEILGFLVSTAFVPAGPATYLAAFLLFRLFDIIKPPPAGGIDRRLSGGWGILLDDVFAGLYTALALALLGQLGAL